MAKQAPIVISARWNAVCTAIFFAEVAFAFAMLLLGRGFVSIPVSGAAAAGLLVLSIIACVGVVWAVKVSSGAAGRVLSRAIFPGDPLAKVIQQHKFEDQMWQ